MKINKKLLSIQAGLIVLAGLFGVSVRSEEQGEFILHRIIGKMPDSHDAWYRQQLAKYWDKGFISVERRKKFTAETVKLANLVWDRNQVAGMTNSSTDTIHMPSNMPLWFMKLLNSIDGRESQTLAHEYIHLAQHGSDVPIDANLEKICHCLKQGKQIHVVTRKSSSNSTAITIDPKLQHAHRHNEFFCELKGLELLEQKDPTAYQAFLKSLSMHKSDRDENYPRSNEFLVIWALYKKAKENQLNASDVNDTILHNIIDEYLKNRDSYKKAMASVDFLTEQASFFSRILLPVSTGGALGVVLAGALSIAPVNAATSLFALMTLPHVPRVAFSTVRIISRLLSVAVTWDKDKFKKILDRDAEKVEHVVRREKLTDNLGLE